MKKISVISLCFLALLINTLFVGVSVHGLICMGIIVLTFFLLYYSSKVKWLFIPALIIQVSSLFFSEVRLLYAQYYVPVVLSYASFVFGVKVKNNKSDSELLTISLFLLLASIITQLVLGIKYQPQISYDVFFVISVATLFFIYVWLLIKKIKQKKEKTDIIVFSLILIYLLLNFLLAPLDESALLWGLFPSVLMLVFPTKSEEYLLKPALLRLKTCFEKMMVQK